MENGHSETYNRLSQEQKNTVDAIISFLSGSTISDIKKIIWTINRELDFRGSLNHQ